MTTYIIGDYLYAKDENRVYKINRLPMPEANYKYYSGIVVGGASNRGFDPEEAHHRHATENEIKIANQVDKVLRVRENTEAFDLLYKAFNYHKKWKENKEEIESFIGCEIDHNLYHVTHTLTLEWKAVKDEWKNQFKKNSNPAQAKKNSKVNKEWIELCKRLGLEVHETRVFQFKYGLYLHNMTYYNYLDQFYIEFDKGIAGGGLYDWAEPISESDFLRVRADFLEQQETQ